MWSLLANQLEVGKTVPENCNTTSNGDAKENVNVSAASTVANEPGHVTPIVNSGQQMSNEIGAIQQSAVMIGFGLNTTQIVIAI